MTGKLGSVVLFFGGMGENTDGETLRQAVREAMRSAGSGGSVGRCNILHITDRDSGREEFGALVEVQPARLALHVIRTLDGTLFQGRRIHVHRYRNRFNWANPATVQWDPDSRTGLDSERRRRNLSIDLAASPTQGATRVWSRFFSPQRTARDFGT